MSGALRMDGANFSKSVVERIFEPFACKYSNGHECGLELFALREIVHAHEGTITATSVLGEGRSLGRSSSRTPFPMKAAAGINGPGWATAPCWPNCPNLARSTGLRNQTGKYRSGFLPEPASLTTSFQLIQLYTHDCAGDRSSLSTGISTIQNDAVYG